MKSSVSTYLHQANVAYIETLLHQYEENPLALEPTWRSFFEGLAFVNGSGLSKTSTRDIAFECRVVQLIEAYREMGYLIADINPLDRRPQTHPLLSLERFGLGSADLGRATQAGKFLGLNHETLGEILETLRTCYCSPVAVEYSHIEDSATRQWIMERVESGKLFAPLSTELKKRILEKLTEAEVFETFLHQRFVAQKRFSAEGNDALIPMVDHLMTLAGENGTDEIIFGTAHRGRLCLLANVFKKDVKSIFAEFAHTLETDTMPGDGDVKYHLGHSGDIITAQGKQMHLSLVSNPSHLEAINPVVVGIVHSKQKLKGDTEQQKTIAVLMHGDASFAGQGSIYELLNMSELAGYSVGGTIHIIINNQLGFTAVPTEGRSTPNATDVAKMLEVPIFRVNADEPEACLRVMELALEFRTTFKRDVFIDLVGYRRYGHNEGDEPSFTQPLLYKDITNHPRVLSLYTQRLVSEGVITEVEATQQAEQLRTQYDAILTESRKAKVERTVTFFEKRWEHLRAPAHEGELLANINTAVDAKKLRAFGEALLSLPHDFSLHPKLVRLFADRKEMLEGKRGIDWGVAEALAFASLISEGYMVRLAGQDSERGTFSHRHAVLHHTETGATYTPLNRLPGARADFEVVNSLLSEYAAMGFEFGQSLANPNKLTMWEAQFGDFANGAQIIIDQFLVGSALKWKRFSGLVLLLPHGYEGMGPEHSSARPERFLQMAAQANIQLAHISTPAQYFHLLRRQMLRDFRVPLVLLTPKSLLRHPRSVSTFDALSKGSFQPVLDDHHVTDPEKANRLILTAGKIYYELLHEQEAKAITTVPLVRVEQYYPFPEEALRQVLARYPHVKTVVWCQEEPQNMGAWGFLKDRLRPLLDGKQRLEYVGRPPQASVSGGYLHVHEAEQQHIVSTGLGIS